MTWEDIMGGNTGSVPIVTKGEAKGVIARIDNEVQRLDAAISGSNVSKQFRRGWRQFFVSWRAHYSMEKDHPSRVGVEQALFFANEARGWKQALARETADKVSGDELGAFIVTPGAMKAELDTVQAGVKQLDADIMSSKTRDAFKNAWQLFSGEWKAFYDSHQSLTSRLFHATYEKTIEYRKRLDEWKGALQREGVQATGPLLAVPQPPPEPSSSFKWWAIGGLIVAGAVLGRKALR